MTRREYLEEIKEDVKEYVRNSGEYDYDEIRYNRDEVAERIHDAAWTDDSITGNASGSYTMSTYKAEENIAHAWDLIEEVATEFGIDATVSSGYEHGPEWWDVSIRCCLLGEAIEEALDELEEEFEEELENEVEEIKEELETVKTSTVAAV